MLILKKLSKFNLKMYPQRKQRNKKIIQNYKRKKKEKNLRRKKKKKNPTKEKRKNPTQKKKEKKTHQKYFIVKDKNEAFLGVFFQPLCRLFLLKWSQSRKLPCQ